MLVEKNIWDRVSQSIELAQGVTLELDNEIEDIIKLGKEQPLEYPVAVQLITLIVNHLRNNMIRRGDFKGFKQLSENMTDIVEEITKKNCFITKEDNYYMNKSFFGTKVILCERNGIPVSPVFPIPFFHEKEIPMLGGFVKTSDIDLWDDNDRLDIHINQFKLENGREPNGSELLEIMLSKMPLPGVKGKDQFKIMELARSIANNGLRRPVIIDLDGTLLDGNRRITACKYILRSSEFSIEQKARVEYVFVWQLTEYATNDDKRRVVVSMNFENDCKEEWSEYIKAKKIYEDWQSMLALETYASAVRQNELLKELSKRYALGSDTSRVKRYIRMMEEAERFETYHIDDCERDEYEVKHKSAEHFQYFDELTKKNVSKTLNEDELLCDLVYDLLFEDKITSWDQIRLLPKISHSEEAINYLREARTEEDLRNAQRKVKFACSNVSVPDREKKKQSINDQIKSFNELLKLLSVGDFVDETIELSVLRELKFSLELVNENILKIEQDQKQREKTDDVQKL